MRTLMSRYVSYSVLRGDPSCLVSLNKSKYFGSQGVRRSARSGKFEPDYLPSCARIHNLWSGFHVRCRIRIPSLIRISSQGLQLRHHLKSGFDHPFRRRNYSVTIFSISVTSTVAIYLPTSSSNITV